MTRDELGGAGRALARRPDLWRIAVVTGWRMLPRRWPRRPPPVGYLAFRRQTMYGRADAAIAGDDVIAYLEWCRRMQGARR